MDGVRRAAARVRRGDALRRLRHAGAALLPSPAPGHVWTDSGGRPRPALVLGSPDLHELREAHLETVLDVIAPVRAVLAPPVPRHPWRLAVRDRDASALRRALERLPEHWQRADAGDRVGLRPRIAAGAREIERTPDLDVVIDVLRREGDAWRGSAQGSLGRIDDAHWDDAAQESLTPMARRFASPAPQFPIDAVYTWVDGSDAQWRDRRDAALGETAGGAGSAPHPSAVGEARFADTDELRFSLRSLHRYAGWVRRIHLVTDGQVPQWLREDSRIRVIDHQELLGGSRFSSHAIESALHRIPGLADHYLYLNDDVFFGRIAHPGDFFAADGVSRFFPSDLPIDPGPASADDPPIMAAAKNGRDLMARRFGARVGTKIRHTVHPQLREVAERIERENPEEIARTRAAMFRSPGDLSVASSLHHWYAHALGRAVPAVPNYLYVDLMAPHAAQQLDALESLRRYDTFCLNTEERALSPQMRDEVREFLGRYFPDPAPWESKEH